MAGSDTQKQLFTLIRDFTSEKSQGERRIVIQKRTIDEVKSELDAANAVLEEIKSVKDKAEQELKGYEVELFMKKASIQALEARIALTNKEVSQLGSEVETLKAEENSLRDAFIKNMLELNAQIREYYELLTSTSGADSFPNRTLKGGSFDEQKHDAQKAREVQENKLTAEMISQSTKEEHEYNSEQVIHDQVQEEFNKLEKKAILLDSVVKESMALQELSRQTSELEEKSAALSDELQKRFLCPRCNQDNSMELGDSQMSQMSEWDMASQDS